MSGSTRVQIGELSALSGVSVRSLRHYERVGLIDSERLANGYRAFPPDAVQRARTIQLLFRLGVDREAVRAVLACSGGATPDVHRATRAQLEHVREQMAGRIAELSSAHAALSEIIDSTAT